MRTSRPKIHRMVASFAVASLSSALFSGATFAQAGDPINLNSIPIENLVIRVPAGMNITYSPKIALASGNTLPAAAVGTAYSFDFKTKATITHDEAPDLSLATWSLLTPAPSGLNISPSGVLSGTPINEGSYSFEVAAIYKGSKDTQVYAMEVTLDVAVALAAGTPPMGVVGQAYTGFDPRSLVQVSGDPSFNIDAVTWSLKSGSALPAGLELNANTGLISGIPTAVFAGPVTLIATYKGESGERTYEFTVEMNITLSLESATLPTATVGQAYEGFDFKTVLNIEGDPGLDMSQATWRLENESALPEGLSIDLNGILSGTPVSENLTGHDFELSASYKEVSDTQSYRIVVNGVVLDVLQIEVGAMTTCALTKSKGVKCWGRDVLGQLGNDAQLSGSPVPVDVKDLTSGVRKISMKSDSACALLDSGGVKCWGWNYYGQLGDGTKTDRATPVSVSGLSSGVVDIDAGVSHTCAVMTSGGVKCWGSDSDGQIGNDASLTDRTTPVDVSNLSDVSRVSVGQFHSCALHGNGSVTCWGANNWGQLGYNNAGKDVPVPGASIASFMAKSISAGRQFNCAITTESGLKCWGDDTYGQLGNDSYLTMSSTPVNVLALTSGVKRISAGIYNACAVLNSGEARCWGSNGWGQLGVGYHGSPIPTPQNVINLGENAVDMSTSSSHTCAITSSGTVKCWGRNVEGQLGIGTYGPASEPIYVPSTVSFN